MFSVDEQVYQSSYRESLLALLRVRRATALVVMAGEDAANEGIRIPLSRATHLSVTQEINGDVHDKAARCHAASDGFPRGRKPRPNSVCIEVGMVDPSRSTIIMINTCERQHVYYRKATQLTQDSHVERLRDQHNNSVSETDIAQTSPVARSESKWLR